MNTADFLVELGTEELPPKALVALSEAFETGITERLAAARLAHGRVHRYAAPRRLAVLIESLQAAQEDQVVEHRGPPVRLAYDPEGMPTRAAEAFAAKCGTAVDNLTTVSTDKGEWLAWRGSVSGAATRDLLGDIVAQALDGLPIPRRMRWGDGPVEFVRPVHWLVMLLGPDIVPAEVLGLRAGRTTRGHRFHHSQAIELSHAADYAGHLERQGRVLADFATRRERVVAGARQAAMTLGGEPVLIPEVVDEVTALVEWPVPVAGRFDKAFLRLPEEVLISTLQDHQRYFPVRDRDGGLLNAFVATSNLDSAQPDEVRRGNERVVVPRLSDAAFFWDKDGETPLAAHAGGLSQVVYQQGLGSLQDKSERVGQLAYTIAPLVGAKKKPVKQAAQLARADLLTDMVGEFPELQGRMGYYYARRDGQPEAVAVAIEEQYLPRQAGDRLPATPTGTALALADRLDTLAGIFTLGKKPSGNKDPYALRRQAIGLVRILVEGNIDIDLPALLLQAAELQPRESKQAVAPATVAAEVYEFITDRLRAWYLDGQAPGFARGTITAEMFQAVLVREPVSLADFHARLQAVQRFMQHDAAESLAAANKRIANILRQADDTSARNVDPALFEADAEQKLHAAVTAVLAGHRKELAERRYEVVLARLADLRQAVDNYFDDVMVMSDDPAQRNNRLAQLSELRRLFLDVADISCISAP